MPNSCPRLEPRELGAARRGECKESRVRRISERADHSCDILERRLLEPPFFERPRRFSLEIEDVEISLRPQHLSQVVVTVNANLRCDKFQRRDAANSFKERTPRLQQLVR